MCSALHIEREKSLEELPQSTIKLGVDDNELQIGSNTISNQTSSWASRSEKRDEIEKEGVRIGKKYASVIDGRVGETQELRRLRNNIESGISQVAPKDQVWLQKRALNRGIREGMDQALKETQRKDALLHMALAMKHSRPFAEWSKNPEIGRASTAHLEKSDAHKIAWKTNPKAMGSGPASHAKLAEEALLHAQKYAVDTKKPHDMRVFMHAGVQLAVATGGDRISPPNAAKLVTALCKTARNPVDGVLLPPDHLRMMVAGMVAVWDHSTCKEVALALLDEGLSLATEQRHEGNEGNEEHAMASAQLRAVSEGLGIGLGWKGMAAVDQGLEEAGKNGRGEVAKELRKNIAAGEAQGVHWLSALTLALPSLNGQDSNTTGVYLEGVNLLSRHHMASPGSVKTPSQSGESPLKTGSFVGTTAQKDWRDDDLFGTDDTEEETGIGDTEYATVRQSSPRAAQGSNASYSGDDSDLAEDDEVPSQEELRLLQAKTLATATIEKTKNEGDTTLWPGETQI